MHNLSTFFQFLRHLTTDTVQFIKICQNCDQHTQHDRDPDKADFNMRQCTRGLYRISYIAAFSQEDSDNETYQSHSAFYEKSLECSDQSRYTCIFLIFRIIDHIWLHCKCEEENAHCCNTINCHCDQISSSFVAMSEEFDQWCCN